MKTLFLILTLSFLTHSISAGIVEKGLSQVPLKDKLAMKEFIKINLIWHQLSHVIYFDNKPMCLASARLKSPDKQHMDVLWVKGFRAFIKHEHLFPHPNFIFSYSIDVEDNWKSINLLIINRRALSRCVENHLSIFQQLLGQQFSFDWLIWELEKRKNFFEILKNDERLIGLLLGYGKEAALAFHEHRTLLSDSHLSSLDDYCPNDVKVPKGCGMFPIVIMGNPRSKEIADLKFIYEKEANEFWKFCQNQDSLELFLKCICEEI